MLILGLVHQGICESGADTNFWTLNWPGQRPEGYLYQTALRNNCTVIGHSDEEIVQCLRRVPWEEFNRGILCRVSII